LLRKCDGLVASFAVLDLIAALYFKDYSAFRRNNSYLNKMIIPVEYVAAIVKYVNRNMLSEPLTHQELGKDVIAPAVAKTRITVLVIYETARAGNYQLNGYPTETNEL